MTTNEIIKAYLIIKFGNDPKTLLKKIVNSALDNNEYYEGFEIATNKYDLNQQEFDDLLLSFESAYKKNLPQTSKIKKIIDSYLPQFHKSDISLSDLSWVVSDDNAIYTTDGFRVVKILNNHLVWATKRISYDGIHLFNVSHNELIGEWFSPLNDENPWNELRVSTKNGELIKGKIISD